MNGFVSRENNVAAAAAAIYYLQNTAVCRIVFRFTHIAPYVRTQACVPVDMRAHIWS